MQTIQKNATEELRIEISEYKGRRNLSLRVWYQSFDGEMRPSRDGFTLPPTSLPLLIEKLQLLALESGLAPVPLSDL